MQIQLSSVFNSSFIQEKISFVLTEQQKKILVIASLALGLLAACYIIASNYCFKANAQVSTTKGQNKSDGGLGLEADEDEDLFDDDVDGKILNMINKLKQNMAPAAFVDFEIKDWSKVKDGSIFSFLHDNPMHAWGHEWWLKVVKSSNPNKDEIGFFLCCGEKSIAYPVTVDYQLVVRKRGSNDPARSAPRFRTIFGKERGWGLYKFTTLEDLIHKGGYSKAEDKITFGCMIWPVTAPLWGPQPGIVTHSSTNV